MCCPAVCGLPASRCGQAGRQCCRLLRGMGVWRLVGPGGCGGSIAASASQYIHHKGGESPALPPHPGVARTADPRALGAGGCCVCPLQGGHRGARMDRGGAGYCVSAMWAAGKPAGQVLHLNRILIGQRASYEGEGGRKSTAISFRPWGGSLPVSQLGKLRHRGEGSPLTCL